MRSTIAALWRGEVRPDMHSGMDNMELQQAEKKLEHCRKRLEAVLNEEQEQLFSSYLSALLCYVNECDEQAFHDGFSLGVKLTAEAMLGAETK